MNGALARIDVGKRGFRALLKRARSIADNAAIVGLATAIGKSRSLMRDHFTRLLPKIPRNRITRTIAAENLMQKIVQIRTASEIHADSFFKLFVEHSVIPFARRRHSFFITSTRTP